MNDFVFIPFLNRPDLLEKAIRTAKMVSDAIFIMDNSAEGVPLDDPAVRVLRPWVPYSFTQSQNWARKHAIENNCTHYYYLHSDCEAAEETCTGLREKVQQLLEEKVRWGVVYTYYDTLCAYSVDCMKEIGEWDNNFPNYFTDNDYYRRMDLAGFQRVETHLPTSHVGSASINSDPVVKLQTGITFPLHARLYVEKWGGEPGKERFKAPYGRPDIFK